MATLNFSAYMFTFELGFTTFIIDLGLQIDDFEARESVVRAKEGIKIGGGRHIFA